MKKILLLSLSTLTTILTIGCALSPPEPSPVPSQTPLLTSTSSPEPSPTATDEAADWNLVWSDEFEGTELDRANWAFEQGGGGWGNNESEYYTNRPENVRVEDGMLVIEARKEKYGSEDYTSGRIKTQFLHSWTFGRIEARMKLPYGQGIWPAFWMMGIDISSSRWPNNGEIDIMEHIGKDPSLIYATVHGPAYARENSISGTYKHTGGSLYDDFHVIGIEWEPEKIEWFIDGEVYFSVTPADVPGVWVYDHPFYMLLNLAVGGGWPGYPDDTTVFPQQYLIDYIRVYQHDYYPPPPPRATKTPLINQTLRLTELSVTLPESGDGWQPTALATVLDDHNHPVEDVTVKGFWIGIVKSDSISMQTGADGIAGPFLTDVTTETGTASFCVTEILKDGYRYDAQNSVDTCGAAKN